MGAVRRGGSPAGSLQRPTMKVAHERLSLLKIQRRSLSPPGTFEVTFQKQWLGVLTLPSPPPTPAPMPALSERMDGPGSRRTPQQPADAIVSERGASGWCMKSKKNYTDGHGAFSASSIKSPSVGKRVIDKPEETQTGQDTDILSCPSRHASPFHCPVLISVKSILSIHPTILSSIVLGNVAVHHLFSLSKD